MLIQPTPQIAVSIGLSKSKINSSNKTEKKSPNNHLSNFQEATECGMYSPLEKYSPKSITIQSLKADKDPTANIYKSVATKIFPTN